MTDKISMNEVVATGRGYIDYDPLRHLKHLRAQVGYRDGYCIFLSEAALRRLDDVIAFNEGRDTAVRNPDV
jgi:hypothetical protein